MAQKRTKIGEREKRLRGTDARRLLTCACVIDTICPRDAAASRPVTAIQPIFRWDAECQVVIGESGAQTEHVVAISRRNVAPLQL